MADPHTGTPVILFDGVCTFCNASVTFIIRRDPAAVFRFAALQSAAGEAYADRFPQLRRIDSLVLIDEDRCYVESSAALRIASRLRGPWKLFSVLLAVPRPVRDAVYRWFARNRYRWFGRKDACMIPSPAIRARFIQENEGTGES